MSSEHFNVDGTSVDAGELVRLGRRFALSARARFATPDIRASKPRLETPPAPPWLVISAW